MASPAERMTVDYPVEVTALPSTDRTVRGIPKKIPADVKAAIKAQARAEGA